VLFKVNQSLNFYQNKNFKFIFAVEEIGIGGIHR
jgi:hypothetical protein